MSSASPVLTVPDATVVGSPVLRESSGDIAVLILNRPRARNTLSEAMLQALRRALADIAEEKAVRAVVLAAKGSVFSAGHDLKELTAHRSEADGGRGYTQHIMQICSAMMLSIPRLPQPVIAAVEGTATAAGCQLVATCDLAVTSSAAKFSTPGVHIGLFCSTPMVALSRNVGRKHAMEMLITGDTISADDAYRIGLVNRVVDPGMARQHALRLAQKISAKSPAYAYAGEVMVQNMMARDAAEGISAFLEKRPPNWHNR
jgi:enoyl-CoA hydratase/carnithine racemase